MSGEHTLKAVRGSFIDVTRTVDNPEEIASALRFIEDGLLLIKQGKVEWFGEWENGIYGHSRFCNTDFDDKLACLNLSGV